MTKQTDIQKTLVGLAKPGMSSKQLRREIENLRLAAFAAMIDIVDRSPDEAIQLQDLALGPATGTSP